VAADPNWRSDASIRIADCNSLEKVLKLIVFDCDGTLVDSQHMICGAMQRAYDAHDIVCPPRETVLSIVGLSLRQAFETLGRGQRDFPVEGMIERYKEAFFELRHSPEHQEPLYPGARDTILQLGARADCVLGIATGKSQRGVRAILTYHDLLTHFSTIMTADDAPSKPDPGMLVNAMRETGAAPRDTVMIGDTSYDMEMARAAGVSAIGVNWGYHAPEVLRASGAERVIESYSELDAALKTLLFAREPA
jgi:phosphoglycolate phosphatase